MDPAKGDAKSEDEHLKRPTKRESKAEKEKDLPCSSSTSDDSSSKEDDDDFFQLHPAELSKPLSSSREQNAAAHNGETKATSDPNGFLGLIDDDCTAPNQPVSEQLSSVPSSTLRVQTMGRLDVPDPNRIPSSIFTRTKSTAPTEWSVASNDSLFSIQLGNFSFSRDQHIHFGSPPGSQRLQTSGFPSSGSGGIGACKKMEEPSAAMVKAKGIKEEGQSPKELLAEPAAYPVSLSCQSDATISSVQSFAFPILTAEGRNSSAKVEPTEPIVVQQEKPRQPPPEPEAPKPAPSRGKNKWLSCFSCCSPCC